jgi:hypothetical protein
VLAAFAAEQNANAEFLLCHRFSVTHGVQKMMRKRGCVYGQVRRAGDEKESREVCALLRKLCYSKRAPPPFEGYRSCRAATASLSG